MRAGVWAGDRTDRRVWARSRIMVRIVVDQNVENLIWREVEELAELDVWDLVGSPLRDRLQARIQSRLWARISDDSTGGEV